MLEKSALNILYSGKFALSTQLINQIIFKQHFNAKLFTSIDERFRPQSWEFEEVCFFVFLF